MEQMHVQLIGLAPALVIASVNKRRVHGRNSENAQPLLVPQLLELLFYSSSESRFLSYVETEHEVSIAFEESMLALFPVPERETESVALEYESTRWKALQVASAGSGVSFLSQLAILTELTTTLAAQGISVFQISTYQTDYGTSVQAMRWTKRHSALSVAVVLVKCEDLERAVACLKSFCDIDMEDDPSDLQSFVYSHTESIQSTQHVQLSSPAASDVAVHQHVLSVPDLDLVLVQIHRAYLRQHMYALVQLLFGNHISYDGSSAHEEQSLVTDSQHRFLSHSETSEDISVVTSDVAFIQHMKVMAGRGDQGVIVSPDSWKVVQIGDKKLGFNETGIVAGQTRVLVNAGTMVFYLSTYATVSHTGALDSSYKGINSDCGLIVQDFMLIKEDEWEDALPILRAHFQMIEGRFAPLTE